MRKYKIVEIKNGHGVSKFQIKGLCGRWIFSAWCDWGNLRDSMKEATDKVEEYINEEKSNQRIKFKEYEYAKVPSHVPNDQVSKFMELKEIKK